MNTNFQYDSKSITKEKALLVAVEYPGMPEKQLHSRLEELKDLIDTMGLDPAGMTTVPLKAPGRKYLTGSGKAEEISRTADDLEADIIVFDNDLSPSQQRNWEKLSGKCVIDRREVILEIFARRARTKEAVLQVALARMEYSLPRLTRSWTHLSRQRGGTRGTRGEGETQLEIDRRIVLSRISRLKQEIKKIKSHRDIMRKKRQSVPVPAGALVGYTNAGKSSLLNAVSGSVTYTEDKLFATLDPSTKQAALPGGRHILLTDTVGFIRNLPHDLVDAFKSTLEEAALADFLIHVLDASNPEIREHFNTTMKVLEDLGAGDKPMIIALNKIDLCPDKDYLEELKAEYGNCVLLSAKTGEGIDILLRKTGDIISSRVFEQFTIPSSRYDLIAMIHRKGIVLEQRYENNAVIIKADVSEKEKRILHKILKE